jgi:pectinesterase
MYVCMQNTLGSKDNGPAVAAKVDADKAAFYDCRFLSYQDTLLDATGRHYYRGCYIEGATDFIFGTGKAFFEVIRIDFAALRLLVLRHIITLFMCY